MPATNRSTLLDGPRASVWYYPDRKIIHHQFRAFVHGNELRAVLDTGVEAFQRHSAHKWLSDDRGNSALTREDSQWVTDDWLPRVMAAGWTHWALVMPEKVIGQLNMRRFVKTFGDQGVTTRIFPSPEEALVWLGSQ